ncbi:hypothetical protein [Halomonas salifodinae]|uniref:hypothetical protein n=1 Tax=Halomonas salifodinae TaxID=438745 RepID=UPI0033A4FB3D
MDQYLRVDYPNRRKVWVDGTPAGWTNRLLQLETGHHVIGLNPQRPDFTPECHEIHLSGTRADAPLVLHFRPREETP